MVHTGGYRNPKNFIYPSFFLSRCEHISMETRNDHNVQDLWNVLIRLVCEWRASWTWNWSLEIFVYWGYEICPTVNGFRSCLMTNINKFPRQKWWNLFFFIIYWGRGCRRSSAICDVVWEIYYRQYTERYFFLIKTTHDYRNLNSILLWMCKTGYIGVC